MRFYELILVFGVIFTSCQIRPQNAESHSASFLQIETQQVDSLLQQMNLDEKIGQLIIVKSNNVQFLSSNTLIDLIENDKIGGMLLQDLPLSHFIDFSHYCNKIAALPLFIATDEKVSIRNQFSGFEQFPTPSTMSTIDSIELHDILADHYLQECKALGINLAFSPSIRQVSEQDSIYDSQVFEGDKFAMLSRAVKKMEQLQEQHILTVADGVQEFYDLERDSTGIIDSLLFKYKTLVKMGVSGLKIDQKVFEIDSLKQMQRFFIENYLQHQLNFHGLVIAEVSENAPPEVLLHTGTDLFVTSEAGATFLYLKKYVEEGLLTMAQLNKKVRKILLAKAWMNEGDLFRNQVQKPEATFAKNSYARLISLTEKDCIADEKKNQILDYFQHPTWDVLVRLLYEHSVILAKNTGDIVPFQEVANRDFRIIQFGQKHLFNFKESFSKYVSYASHLYRQEVDGSFGELNLQKFQSTNPILVFDHVNLFQNHHAELIKAIHDLNAKTPTVIINFGNPLNLEHFDTTITTIQIFERNDFTEAVAAQLLFGGATAKGKLPLEISENLKFRQGHRTSITRMQYGVPEQVGIAAHRLVGIDAIAKSAINNQAMPGCQVVVAKGGKIIYSKTFGYHTYQKQQKVRKTDLYDIASITKVAATTLASMRLFETKKFKVTDKISERIPCGDSVPIKNVSLKSLFTHQSGLQPHMPIARYISRKDTTHSLCNRYFCKEKRDSFNVQVAKSLFFNPLHIDSIWHKIYNLKVDKRKRFRYSDVNFILLQKMIETLSEQPLDKYTVENFYEPLGLRHLLFNPLNRYNTKDIVPTEEDRSWRRELLQGYVHDESAALFGGVAGNAGLFSNAEDLVVLFEMLLNGGYYGDKQYFQQETIKFFTTASHGNHRGLGFDKPSMRTSSALAEDASPATFGHSGFTGTCVWADPAHDLIFVFLANRIHPSVWNRKLFREGVRRRMHEVVYDALESFELELPQLEVKG